MSCFLVWFNLCEKEFLWLMSPNTSRSILKMIISDCGLSSTISTSLTKFEQVLRSILFKNARRFSCSGNSLSTLIKASRYIVACKPTSYFLPYWFCTEHRPQTRSGWLYRFLSLYWSEFPAVCFLGRMNDKPNSWAKGVFVYVHRQKH